MKDATYVQDLRDLLQELIVDTLSEVKWTAPTLSFFGTTCRAIARRQFEALKAATDASESGTGYVAVMFLRPACEELIWIRYLRTIDRRLAEMILGCISTLEISGNLQAQLNYAGLRMMKEGGFSAEFLADAKDRAKEADTMLRGIGIRLKWRSSKHSPFAARVIHRA